MVELMTLCWNSMESKKKQETHQKITQAPTTCWGNLLEETVMENLAMAILVIFCTSPDSRGLREEDLISNSPTVLAAGYDWESQVRDWNPKTDNFEIVS